MAKDKPKSPEPIFQVRAAGTLLALGFDRDGRGYVGGSGGTVSAFDLNAAAPTLTALAHDDSYVSGLAVLDRGPLATQVVVARYDGSLTWLDPNRRQVLRRVDAAHSGWIRDLVLLPDRSRLATIGDDMRLKVWDAETGNLEQTFTGHSRETPEGYVSALYALAASPDGQVLATADRAGEVRIWDLGRGAEAGGWRAAEFYTFDPEKRDRAIGGIRRMRFSPDGNRLALSGIGAVTNVDGFVGPNRIEVWDWRTAKRLHVLQDPHQAILNDVLWSPDGTRLLAAGGGDGGGLLVLWEPGQKEALRRVPLKGHIHSLAWLDSSQFLAAGFEEVSLWNLAVLLAPDSR